jgi:hypothetical protein
MRRRLRTTLLFLGLGFVTTLAVALLFAVLQDVQLGRESQGSAYVDDEQWTITRWDRAGAIQIKSVRIKGASWSPQQAAGAPDTLIVGDQSSAWASQTADSGPEWLILEYARAVIPRQIKVYESCGPGALIRVSAFDETDTEHPAWSGTDPSPLNSAATGSPVPVSTIPISLQFPTRKIKIELDSGKVPGWNEVDAVALISDKNELQWARKVRASSTYASGFGASAAAGNPDLLVPSWSGLQSADAAIDSGLANREERQVDARGWPMVALMSTVDTLARGGPTTPPLPSVSTYSLSGGLGGGPMSVTTPSPNRAPVPIPLHPIWIGLIGDTLIFSTAWFTLWTTLVIPRRFVREVARFRRGACIQCGYDLGYDFIQGCPECGWRRYRQDTPPSSAAASIAMKPAPHEPTSRLFDMNAPSK